MENENPCNENRHKESCGYSIQISKQFITLASAGIAFVVGLAIAPNTAISSFYYWTGGCCFFSICFGLIFIMSTIAHINKNDNYNVYTPQLRFLAFMQITLFLVGIIVLSQILFNKIDGNSHQSIKSANTNFSIKSGNKEINHFLNEKNKPDLVVSESGKIDLTVTPIKE